MFDREELRLRVYCELRDTGRAPTVASLASQLSSPEGEVRSGLRELAAERHLVLDGEDRIVMAHPFSAIPLGFSVMGRDTLWWGGCCWDSFALPHLVPDEGSVLVATRCPSCDSPGAWVVTATAPPTDNGWIAHFLVPVQHMWDDVVHTCGHQRLFCSEGCIDSWCAANGEQRGYVMDLETLWNLASHWYDGRLQRGYTRREPAHAAEYLRGVGLIDPFWGTA
ncbi:MAG: organomercurial lyase [Actinomycetota bacterium]